MLAKDKNPPRGAKTKGNLLEQQILGQEEAFRFVSGPPHQRSQDQRFSCGLRLSLALVSAADDFFWSLSFCVSPYRTRITLKQYLQLLTFISIWSTAYHQLICLSDLQCHIRGGNEQRIESSLSLLFCKDSDTNSTLV